MIKKHQQTNKTHCTVSLCSIHLLMLLDHVRVTSEPRKMVRILRILFIWPYSEPVMQCMLDLYVVVLSIVLWP